VCQKVISTTASLAGAPPSRGRPFARSGAAAFRRLRVGVAAGALGRRAPGPLDHAQSKNKPTILFFIYKPCVNGLVGTKGAFFQGKPAGM
jgi:hypothetical protein